MAGHEAASTIMRNQSNSSGTGGGELTQKMKELTLEKDGLEADKDTQSAPSKDEQDGRLAPCPRALPDNPEVLPQVFTVKALGKRESRGLWGIKHTRGPVDDMIVAARAMKPGSFLPFLQLRVARDGVHINEMPQNQNRDFEGGCHAIDVISYGVQDLVYTRVFAMIVVREDQVATTPQTTPNPPSSGIADDASSRSKPLLECHAFVCDSRQSARRLTFALATAFKEFSATAKGRGERQERARQFAIDLRSPDEMRAELQIDSEA